MTSHPNPSILQTIEDMQADTKKVSGFRLVRQPAINLEVDSDISADRRGSGCSEADSFRRDEPISVQMNTKGSINQNGSKLAWYQIREALHRVSNSGRISGQEFTIINGWGGLLTVVAHVAIFATLFVLSYRGTNYSDPAAGKKTAIACLLFSWLLSVFEVVVIGGYCLFRMDHPLVRSRGYIYIGLRTLGLFGSSTFFCLSALIELGIIRTSIIVYVLLLILAESCAILVSGAQAARQRLLYMLFEIKTQPSKGVYRWTFASIFSWIVLIATTLAILGLLDIVKYHLAIDLVVNIGVLCPAFAILRYTYLSRNVALAFTDWQRAVAVSVIVAVLSVSISILHATLFHCSTPSKLTSYGRTFTVLYVIHFSICICALILFGQIAGIVYFGLSSSRDLDPKSVFLNSQPLGKATTVYSAQGGVEGRLAHSSSTIESFSCPAASSATIDSYLFSALPATTDTNIHPAASSSATIDVNIHPVAFSATIDANIYAATSSATID